MDKVIEIKEQVYKLNQYANEILQDLENKMQAEKNGYIKQIDNLNDSISQKEKELENSAKEIKMLKEKLAGIDNLLYKANAILKGWNSGE